MMNRTILALLLGVPLVISARATTPEEVVNQIVSQFDILSQTAKNVNTDNVDGSVAKARSAIQAIRQIQAQEHRGAVSSNHELFKKLSDAAKRLSTEMTALDARARQGDTAALRLLNAIQSAM